MERTGHILDHRYRLGTPVGEGGMATVYVAEDMKLGKAVAVKVLHAEYADQPKVVQRLVQEARAICAVDHPNVVDVTDVGATPDGGVYLVMELLQGEDLKTLLQREGPLPWSRLGPIVMQICAALAAAHAKGILHRDVKPSNCFRVRGGGNRDFIKVLDFGIAKVFAGDAEGPRSTSGVMLGTPEYMAPELPRGLAADVRADVYAVGVLMYKLLTGTAPFVDEGYVAILTQHMYEPVEPPRTRAPDRGIPPEVEAVILRALAKERDARFPTMRALAEAVAATLPGGPSVGAWLSDVQPREDVAGDPTAEAPPAEGVAVGSPASAGMSRDEVPSEVLPFADTRRIERTRRWPLGTVALAAAATLVIWLVVRAAMPRPAFDVIAARAQVDAIAGELRTCGEPLPLVVVVDAGGTVTRVEAAPEAKQVDAAVLACMRTRIARERFAESRSGGPFRVVVE